MELAPTFMGATKFRPSIAGRRRAYIDLVIHEMIPAVARDTLAEWCDVFCEVDVFTPDESGEILQAGATRDEAADPRRPARRERRIRGRGQLSRPSADHLIFVDAAGADGLAKSGVVATLLPIASFT